MLTVVAIESQLRFTPELLTLVCMNKLCARLEEAMGEKITRSDLSAAIKVYGGSITRAGMSKWFDKRNHTATMKAEHVFPVAARCNVDPEWLATGNGSKIRKYSLNGDKLPSHRLALIKAYGSLAKDVRRPIRALIETLAVASNPNYHRFEDQLAQVSRRVQEESDS